LIEAFLKEHSGPEEIPVASAEHPELADLITKQGRLRTTPAGSPAADPRMAGLDGFFAARLRRRAQEAACWPGAISTSHNLLNHIDSSRDGRSPGRDVRQISVGRGQAPHLWGLAARQVWRRLRRRLRAGPVYRWRYTGRTPERVLIAPPDLR